MTREETKTLLLKIVSIYPNYKPENLTFTIDAWASILEPYDATVINNAFLNYSRVDRTGFAPSPSKLIGELADEQMAESLSDGEVVQMLTMASRNANYGYHEEFSKMPKLLQKAIGGESVLRSWGQMEQEQLSYQFNRIAQAYRRLADEEVKTAIRTNNLQIGVKGVEQIEQRRDM